MATAGFSTANYNSLATATLPKWLNQKSTQDIVHRATPGLWYMFANAKFDVLPHDLMIRLNESFGGGVTWFEYYDLVSTTPVKGAAAARTDVKQLSAPITISLQEAWELDTPEKIMNHMELVAQKQLLAIGRSMAEYMYRGNAVNTKAILGLEQWAYALSQWDNSSGSYTVPSTLAYINDRWRARQATNTVANIARTGYSAVETGTGWENVAIDFDPAGSNSDTFGFTSGAPNAAMIALDQGYSFASVGNTEHPDLILSTKRPWDDYRYALMGKTTIFKDEDTMKDMQFGFANVKYQNAIWFPDDYAISYDDVGSVDEAAGTDKLYIINTDYTHLLIDSRANFALGEELLPMDQHAFTRHIVWRGQLISSNPQTLAVLFNYGA